MNYRKVPLEPFWKAWDRSQCEKLGIVANFIAPGSGFEVPVRIRSLLAKSMRIWIPTLKAAVCLACMPIITLSWERKILCVYLVGCWASLITADFTSLRLARLSFPLEGRPAITVLQPCILSIPPKNKRICSNLLLNTFISILSFSFPATDRLLLVITMWTVTSSFF